MADEIKQGDVVVLKSGGPEMTVAWVEQNEALCEWFDSKQQPQHKRYAIAVLKPAK